jgi:hypothetical protein
VKARNATIHQETIKNCHSKLLTTGSVMDARTEMAVHPQLTYINTSGCSQKWTMEACGTYGAKERLEFSPAETP